jgi:tetratricopeptide (TPR) repeat protein
VDEDQPAKAPGEARTGTAPAPVAAVPKTSLPFQQALTTLTSPQASYEQKQSAWKQLKDSGKLSETITELEAGAISNPNSPEYPAALGQACLQKAGTLSDIREQGILGMKADQSFDAALNLDASNWEAGFWKATAMSYWPPQLGKGQEVIERFVNLVKLQETQTTQPQFAQTYLSLGEQYAKQGYPDYARQVWQRGATLFPNEGRFNEKLSQPAGQQSASR